MVRRVIAYQAEKKGKDPLAPQAVADSADGEEGFAHMPEKVDRMQRIMDFHGLDQLKGSLATPSQYRRDCVSLPHTADFTAATLQHRYCCEPRG